MKNATSPAPVGRIPDATFEPLDLRDPLQEHIRGRITELITTVFDAQIDEAIGAERYARETRGGYRHGHRDRTITTSFGPAKLRLPRARVFTADGGTEEFQPNLIRGYARRTAEVDATILMSYLAGENTRRIEKALAPMLKDAPLTKSTVSRVVQQLKRSFDKWRTRSLKLHRIAYLFLDAIVVPVKSDRRSSEMAVLVALGVHETGERELLGLKLAATESGPAWKELIEDLASRDLQAPLLCIIDGHQGLRKAIASAWASCFVQRCTVHKARNLETHCPKHAWPEMYADYRAIVEASSLKAARAAYARFQRVWTPRCPAAVESLAEAGDELLTHYQFPRAQWRALRTTNAIERVNEEFRRRIKTQGSLPSDTSVLYLFYGIWASGLIRLRKIDGWREQQVMVAVQRGDRPSADDAASQLGRDAETKERELRRAA